MNWELEGKVALVTGAAAGIGAAIAEALQASGAAVHGADVAWQDGSPALAGRAEFDVTDRAGVRKAVAAIVAAEGRLDVLVNAAGTMRAYDDLLAYGDEDWDVVVGVNGRGTFTCIQEAVRVMGEEAAIVNIGSVAGRNGRTLSPPYAASKAAVINLTQSVSRWWRGRESGSTPSAPG